MGRNTRENNNSRLISSFLLKININFFVILLLKSKKHIEMRQKAIIFYGYIIIDF